VGQPWVVEFFNVSPDEDAYDELADDLSEKQAAQLFRQFQRLAEHGPLLDGNYFAPIRGSKVGLSEFRLSVHQAEIRFLYRLVGRTYRMVLGFVHHGDRDVRRRIKPAEERLARWETNNP